MHLRLSRNTRRRLSLYGTAVFVAVLVWSLPSLIALWHPRVPIRKVDVPAALANEATRRFMEYMRIDTSNPPGDVRAAARFWAELFACEGIPYEIVGADPTTPIFVARLAGSRRGEGLMLLHHMDVVPAGDLSVWRYPPFAAEQGKGLEYTYLMGRGAFDMKSQAIANFFAMITLHRAGIVPLHDIVFVGEPAEETFSPQLGVGWLMEHRPDLIEGVTDVFNEGGVNEAIVGHVERFGIEVLQKAVIDLNVDAPAKEPLLELQKALIEKDKTLPFSLSEPIKDFMRFLAPSRADLWGRIMAEPENAYVSERFREVAPEPYRALIKDMLYEGAPYERPGGGFRMRVVCTLLPGSSVSARTAELLAFIRNAGLDARVQFVTLDSVATECKGRAWDAIYETLSLDAEKAPVGVYVLSGQYTHSSYLRAHGFRAFGVSPFNVNIQDAGKIHQPNERIDVGYFVEGVERMERIVREFATKS